MNHDLPAGSPSAGDHAGGWRDQPLAGPI